MDLVDILPDVRCWPEVLCCTILTHIRDLDIKVTDFEILCLKPLLDCHDISGDIMRVITAYIAADSHELLLKFRSNSSTVPHGICTIYSSK